MTRSASLPRGFTPGDGDDTVLGFRPFGPTTNRMAATLARLVETPATAKQPLLLPCDAGADRSL